MRTQSFWGRESWVHEARRKRLDALVRMVRKKICGDVTLRFILRF